MAHSPVVSSGYFQKSLDRYMYVTAVKDLKIHTLHVFKNEANEKL